MRSVLKLGTLVAIVSAINLAMIVVVLSALPMNASGVRGEETGCTAGDVTGDGVANLVDPIYLLEWLFTDGPDPVACAQDCPAPAWPPHPADVVNISDGIELEFGEAATIYPVPDGRWLIVTRLEVRIDSNDELPKIGIHELLDGESTLKRGKSFSGYDGEIGNYAGAAYTGIPGVGLTFAPGSEVQFEWNAIENFSREFTYELTGYLVDDE